MIREWLTMVSTVLRRRCRVLPALVLLCSVCSSLAAQAGWQLDNRNSQLNFVSVKAGDIGEVHSFSQLSGGVSDTGEVNVTIHLASVDTLIPLRDERMREMLFETGAFPTALLHGHLSIGQFTKLAVGDSVSTDTTLMLDLHGKREAVTASLLIARLGTGRFMITSQAPVVLQTDTFGLSAGVEKLRAAAGLPSISKSVPVTFVFTLVAE